MPAHPCDKGLTPACFRSYHKWAKQAMAYKLTRLLLPKELSRRLPGVLRNPLIGPGAILPPGLVLPPGTIVPPGFTWPEHWTPWQYFDFTTLEDPRTLFPADWTPADPLPPGVTIAPGAVFPPTWTPADPLPPGVTIAPGAVFPPAWTPADPPPPIFIPGYSPFPTPPDSGAAPPLFIPPFEPGPVHPPAPGPAKVRTTVSIDAWTVGYIQNTGAVWATVHDSLTGNSWGTIFTATGQIIRAALIAGTFTIRRGIFGFNTLSCPVGAVAVSGYISIYFASGSGYTAGMQSTLNLVYLQAADYARFSGDAFALTGLGVGWKNFPLSASAIAYINSTWRGNHYFMLRESDRDLANVAPISAEDRNADCYTHRPTSTYKPKIVITYEQ